jgi:hypothetical protein
MGASLIQGEIERPLLKWVLRLCESDLMHIPWSTSSSAHCSPCVAHLHVSQVSRHLGVHPVTIRRSPSVYLSREDSHFLHLIRPRRFRPQPSGMGRDAGPPRSCGLIRDTLPHLGHALVRATTGLCACRHRDQ